MHQRHTHTQNRSLWMTVGRLHNSATATHSYIIFLVCHSSMGPFSCNHSLIPPHAHKHTHTHTCCVSIQGLHPSKDPAFEVFEDESSGVTLLTTSAVVKWDSLAFGAFPGCVTRCFTLTLRFLLPRPVKVTICAMLCCHFLSFFLSFFFFGSTKNLGICEATKHSSSASSKKSEKKASFVGCIWRSLWIGTAFALRCDVTGLQMRPLKDANPELRQSNCVAGVRVRLLMARWLRRTKQKQQEPALLLRWEDAAVLRWVCVCVCMLEGNYSATERI